MERGGAVRTTPIVSSLDLDLYWFFFRVCDRSDRRKRAHHELSASLRQVTARHKKFRHGALKNCTTRIALGDAFYRSLPVRCRAACDLMDPSY